MPVTGQVSVEVLGRSGGSPSGAEGPEFCAPSVLHFSACASKHVVRDVDAMAMTETSVGMGPVAGGGSLPNLRPQHADEQTQTPGGDCDMQLEIISGL